MDTSTVKQSQLSGKNLPKNRPDKLDCKGRTITKPSKLSRVQSVDLPDNFHFRTYTQGTCVSSRPLKSRHDLDALARQAIQQIRACYKTRELKLNKQHLKPEKQKLSINKSVLIRPRAVSASMTERAVYRYSKSKYFSVIGDFPALVQALKERKWLKASKKVDFLWTTNTKDIDFSKLTNDQICNHFQKTGALTTKIGLLRALKSISNSAFFPRCFDLKTEQEKFTHAFKTMKAESILKLHVQNSINIPSDVLSTAVFVCKHRKRKVSDKQWATLNESFDLTETTQEIDPKATKAFNHMIQKNPQTHINGKENTWIVKPAGMSRGRGIACYSDLGQIFDHTSKGGMWVVQKYIENPLLVHSKKFDIRQWVLVTSWNPLNAWFYEKSYCRFGVDSFDLQDLANVYSHLTNNSISKNSETFVKDESMWHSDQLASFLQDTKQWDIWEGQIKPKVKHIVLASLESARGTVKDRKQSFEVYGYDFMIDQECNPWLIEVNKSPALDYSTPVTEGLIKVFLEDIVKVVLDYPHNSTNTGDFTYLQTLNTNPSKSLDLECEGDKLK